VNIESDRRGSTKTFGGLFYYSLFRTSIFQSGPSRLVSPLLF
jgi:hypothetical protein